MLRPGRKIEEILNASGIVKQPLHLVTCSLLLCLICTNIVVAGQSTGDEDEEHKKIRAGFVTVNSSTIAILPEMANNGMNAVVAKFQDISFPMTQAQKNLVTKWALECEKYNLSFYPTLNFYRKWEAKWINPTNKYSVDGVRYENSPCPFDEHVYSMSVHNRFVELAQMSKSIPIKGIIMNTELFDSEFWYPQFVCHCDGCWDDFRNANPKVPNVELKTRSGYLRSVGLTKDYANFEIRKLAQMASKTRLEINEINSSLIIGFGLIDQPGPFHEGLARGLGSHGPIYLFSQQTYQSGYSAEFVDNILRRFKAMGVDAKFVVGIWQEKIPVKNLAEQYYYSARNCAGYWIYSMQMLMDNWAGQIPSDIREYWGAISLANSELDKSEADATYKSSLSIHPFSSVLTPVNLSRIFVPQLDYVSRNDSPKKKMGEPMLVRGKNKLLFNAQKDDLIKFEVEFDQRSFKISKLDHCEVLLITKEGEAIICDEATKDDNAVLETKAPYSGTYCVVINSDSGTNVRVVESSHYYCYDAGEWPNLYTVYPLRTINFFKPANGKVPVIGISIHNISGSVLAVFESESGREIARYDVKGKQQIKLPLNNLNEEQVFSLSFPDVSWMKQAYIIVTAEDGLSRYISNNVNGLMR